MGKTPVVALVWGLEWRWLRAHRLHLRGAIMPTLRTSIASLALILFAPAPALAMPGGGAARRPGKPAATPAENARAGGVRATIHLKDGRTLPLFAPESSEAVVARVGGEPIRVRELGAGFAAAHESAAQGERPDVMTVLQRLVDARLVVLEAKAMGIEELPQYKKQLEVFQNSALRDAVKEQLAAGAKLDKKRIEARYREAVREWNVRSLRFAKEEDAKALAATVAAGGKFPDLARKAVADKKAEGSDQVDALPEDKMLPGVLAQIQKLSPGGTTPAFKVPTGFAVVQYLGQQFPEKPEVRAQMEEAERVAQRSARVRDGYQALIKKHAAVDKKLLAAVDFDAEKPGFAALTQDKRVLVRIAGDPPVTVADLAAEIRTTFFHGAERAAQKQRLNPRKDDALDAVLLRRLLLKEGKARKLQSTKAYREQLEEYQHGVLFGAAVERAVLPDVKVEEADLRAHYEQHRSAYTLPRFLRLRAIGFTSAAAAEAGLKKLRAGTEFAWYAQNAPDRIDPEKATVKLDGSAVMASELPAELTRSLAGAKKGDYRQHGAGSEHYVIHVDDEIAPASRPFEEVQGEIQKKVYAEKVGQALKGWTAKLRQGYPVEVLVDRVGG